MTSNSDDELKVGGIWSRSSVGFWAGLLTCPCPCAGAGERHILGRHPGQRILQPHSLAGLAGNCTRAVQGVPVLLMKLSLFVLGKEPGKGAMLRGGDGASAGDTGPCFSWAPFVSPVHFSRGWRGGNAISLLSVSVCRACAEPADPPAN